MKSLYRVIMSIAGAALLAACATPPVGPTVAVMPGSNKNFDAFAADQSVCTGYASQQVRGETQLANNQAVGGAVLGTVLGAGLGAAAGGGPGAAIGAASGAVAGTALGAGYSGGSNYGTQQRYNIAYAQCMAAKGNQVPRTQVAYGPPSPAPATGYYAPGSFSGYPYGYYPGFYGWGWPGISVGWGGGCCWGGWRGGWGWGRGWHH